MKIQPRHIRSMCIAAALSSFAWPSLARAPAGRYTIDSTNGTVLDKATGLMWQRDVPGSSYTWLDALAYCEGLSLASHSDWRLPNRKELHTIVDVSTYDPAIDTAAFPGTPSSFFWSSSPSGGLAWGVVFYNGDSYSLPTDSNGPRVRCVR